MKNVLLYYSADRKPEQLATYVRTQILQQAKRLGWPIIGCTVKPATVFDDWVQQTPHPAPTGIIAAVLQGLTKAPDDAIVWLCEDDVLYHPSHFDLGPVCPACTINYDLSMVFLAPGGFFDRCNRGSIALSQSWARVPVMRRAMERKLGEIAAGTFNCYEPAGSLGYATSDTRAAFASVDIRHGHNTTWSAGAETYFEHEPGWPPAHDLLSACGLI